MLEAPKNEDVQNPSEPQAQAGQDAGRETWVDAGVRRRGWLLTGSVALAALLILCLAVHRSVVNPRTDDAEILANFIGVAPQVEGQVSVMSVADNQYVHAGDLLFSIDDRPYQYALAQALSDQAALEGQIEDRRRQIRSQFDEAHSADASVASSTHTREATRADVGGAEAEVLNGENNVRKLNAELEYADDHLHRLEPLLEKMYVTVDQVDKARSEVKQKAKEVAQAENQVAQLRKQVASSDQHFQQTVSDVSVREQQRNQAYHAIAILDPLTAQREQRAAAVRQAQYNLNNCRIHAPFDGYVNNLNTAQGAYVHVGTQLFTLIDARQWWATANFRETQLANVAPGSAAEVFLLSQGGTLLHGTVTSIGYGVSPDPSVGSLAPGLPSITRTLSWVHLATRYPVRIRIDAPPPGMLRVGQSVVAVIHPDVRRDH